MSGRARRALPRARRSRAGLSWAVDQRRDEVAVRGGAGTVGQIYRVLEPSAQIAAEFGGAAVQRPDFLAANRGDAPARVGVMNRSRVGSRSGSAGMPDSTPITKLYFGGRS